MGSVERGPGVCCRASSWVGPPKLADSKPGIWALIDCGSAGNCNDAILADADPGHDEIAADNGYIAYWRDRNPFANQVPFIPEVIGANAGTVPAVYVPGVIGTIKTGPTGGETSLIPNGIGGAGDFLGGLGDSAKDFIFGIKNLGGVGLSVASCGLNAVSAGVFGSCDKAREALGGLWNGVVTQGRQAWNAISELIENGNPAALLMIVADFAAGFDIAECLRRATGAFCAGKAVGNVAIAALSAGGAAKIAGKIDEVIGAVRQADDLITHIDDIATESGMRGGGDGYAGRVLEGGRPDGQTVFAGHGEYRYGAGSTTVPEGTSVNVYAPHGQGIPDSLGGAIETGGPASPYQVYGPGEQIPNYTLKTPDGLTVYSGSTTVQSSTNLSELLQPGMGTCHWAACVNVR